MRARGGAPAADGLVSRKPFAGFWYVARAVDSMKPGSACPVQLLDQPVLLLRDHAGAVTALRDVCPHRGMPLRYGEFDGTQLECSYHGWRFGSDGRCVSIPSLRDPDAMDVGRIHAHAFACREMGGFAWVSVGDTPEAFDRVPEIERADARPLLTSTALRCSAEHALYALLGTNFSLVQEAEEPPIANAAIEPTPLGWRQPRRRVSLAEVAGESAWCVASYALPGIRLEHIEVGEHRLGILTTVTPATRTRCEVHLGVYGNRSARSLASSIGRRAEELLAHLRDVVQKQAEGLAHCPTLMLVGAGDASAKRFDVLEREWQAAATERRAFRNPLRRADLRR